MGRMALRSAVVRICGIHSFGRSRENVRLRHSFGRSTEVMVVSHLRTFGR